MVDECNRRSKKSGSDPKQPPPLPLIRLKVDYTGFSTINSQRFGQKFVGKVANPHDVLHWHKAAAKKLTKVNSCAWKSFHQFLQLFQALLSMFFPKEARRTKSPPQTCAMQK